MKRRGISPVVATVLVILITIIAAGLIAPFVTNFVKDNLDDSGSCFEVLGDLEFAETGFNCYYNISSNPSNLNTGFSVRVGDETISGFKISLIATGSSDSFDVSEGATLTGIKMLENPPVGMPSVLEFPDVGGVKTYVVSGKYDRAEVSPVLENGNTCSVSDSIQFIECNSAEAVNLIGA